MLQGKEGNFGYQKERFFILFKLFINFPGKMFLPKCSGENIFKKYLISEKRTGTIRFSKKGGFRFYRSDIGKHLWYQAFRLTTVLKETNKAQMNLLSKIQLIKSHIFRLEAQQIYVQNQVQNYCQYFYLNFYCFSLYIIIYVLLLHIIKIDL